MEIMTSFLDLFYADASTMGKYLRRHEKGMMVASDLLY